MIIKWGSIYYKYTSKLLLFSIYQKKKVDKSRPFKPLAVPLVTGSTGSVSSQESTRLRSGCPCRCERRRRSMRAGFEQRGQRNRPGFPFPEKHCWEKGSHFPSEEPPASRALAGHLPVSLGPHCRGGGCGEGTPGKMPQFRRSKSCGWSSGSRNVLFRALTLDALRSFSRGNFGCTEGGECDSQSGGFPQVRNGARPSLPASRVSLGPPSPSCIFKADNDL